jgi:hypothetical protein
MKADVRKTLSAFKAPSDLRADQYQVGFYAIGYERRSRYVAETLALNTKLLCGLEYETDALAIRENREWADRARVIRRKLDDYRLDGSGNFKKFVDGLIQNNTVIGEAKTLFVDVSSMDRSLIARLLASIFSVIQPPFNLRLCYAPGAFIEPQYVFVPTRECAPAIPELAGVLGIHQSNLSLLLGLGFEYGVSLGLLELLEPDHAVILIPKGTDPRYDRAVKRANFDYDFGLENIRLVPFQVNQPLTLFESIFSICSEATISRRVVIAPNGPKILAALATVVGLFHAPHITVLRASLASQPSGKHIEADGDIVAIDFRCP